MNNNLTTQCVAIVLLIICMFPIFSLIARATDEITEPSSNDLWNCLGEFQESSNLYDMLSAEGWIDEDVTFTDFDYILVTANQICTMNPNVRLSLILAIIAEESGFYARCEYHGARGLMQITAPIISDRMPSFVEADHEVCLEDAFDVRLNLATGIDYINYILGATNGDESYALMWYNQGPKSASIDYVDHFYTSEYALDIQVLANKIEPYLITGEG